MPFSVALSSGPISDLSGSTTALINTSKTIECALRNKRGPGPKLVKTTWIPNNSHGSLSVDFFGDYLGSPRPNTTPVRIFRVTVARKVSDDCLIARSIKINPSSTRCLNEGWTTKRKRTPVQIESSSWLPRIFYAKKPVGMVSLLRSLPLMSFFLFISKQAVLDFV